MKIFNKINYFKLLSLVVFLQLINTNARARDLNDFISTCGYGAVIGAVAGGLSLAFSDHPTSSMNPIARGASYGLYAGIITGIYLHEKQFQKQSPPPELAFISPRIIQDKTGQIKWDGFRGDFIMINF